MSTLCYIVITPVRDEDRFVGRMIESMIGQTHRPLHWVIVNDGSTDNTGEIVERRASDIHWITILNLESEKRDLGTAEITAFSRGLSLLDDSDFEFVVKLDADLDLPPHYFEELLSRMTGDPSWGIGSGVYWENTTGEWMPVKMPHYHAAGACKVVRRKCFEEIGGFVASKGWDTLDEIRAGMRGWKTGHFADIRFDHLKPEGAAMGRMATHRFHGLIYYRLGGGWFLLVLKALQRMVYSRPLVLGGIALATGYWKAAICREERLVNVEEMRFYRRLLNQRIRSRFIESVLRLSVRNQR